MELLEREAAQAALGRAVAEAAGGAGRIVLLAGEAGVGKTALLATLPDAGGGARVLVGRCDPLLTPRALGPFHEMAVQAGGALAAAAASESPRDAFMAAALGELAAPSPPRVIVVEDAHWADDSTLDVIVYLGRRVEGTPGCLVVSYRSDELAAREDLRAVLGSLPAPAVRRLELAPLSPDAVGELARRAGRDAHGLHAVTGGNPFFVTEVLATDRDARVPATVRDAVLARGRRLSPDARRLVQLVSVVPGRAELWLVEETVGAGAEIDACLASGVLETDGAALRFRHEIARHAVADELTALARRDLERRVLSALVARPGSDPARLVHHARGAGDDAAVLRHAPQAARDASAAGAHRQAAEHFRAALGAGDALAPAARAGLLESLAFETYLAGPGEEALACRRAALAIREELQEPLRVGENLRWIARLLWWVGGQRAEAEAAAERAVAVLERVPAGRELAMAYSNRSQLAMLSWNHPVAVEWGSRAIALARRLGDRETLAHALTNVGTVRFQFGDPEGRAMLDDAVAIAAAEGLHDHAQRALVNLGWSELDHGDITSAREVIARGLAYARDHELRSYFQYLLGMRAEAHLLAGEWEVAERDAREALAMRDLLGIGRHPALVALALLLTRRGAPEADAVLREAWERALPTEELQRLAPAAAGRAERAWLEGDTSRVADAARDVYALALASGEPQAVGVLAFWMWRGGALTAPPPSAAEAYALSIAGDWRAAAALWERRGFVYQRAEALSHAGEEPALLEALAIFERLGAAPAAARLRGELRRRGVRRIPRGPHRDTRASPAGLTPRQRDVLALVATGATNNEIAERLVLSARTVDHHVAAVLAKLGASSRRDAVRAARDLGIGAGEMGSR